MRLKPASPWIVRGRLCLREFLLPLGLCLLGLLLAHYPMLLSGFERVQTDRFDTRLNNFILEHGYRWLRGDPAHRDFWSPGVFFPAPNTFAYSEILVGVGPFYWVWRWLGLPPDTSFQFWMLTLGVLNFASAYLVLRHGVRLHPLAAAAGAFLFAFGSPRLAHLIRQQLLAQFYAPLAVYFLALAFQSHLDPQRPAWTRLWIFLFSACVVAQFYACYYLGWFLALGLGVALLWALALREYREVLVSFARAHLLALTVVAAASGLTLYPMALHYLQARWEVPKRHYMDVLFSMPSWPSWLYMGTQSWCYGWTDGFFDVGTVLRSEPIGIGLLTTVAAAFGLWRERERPTVRLAILVTLTILAYTIVLANERELCRAQFLFVPGAYAVRACHRVVFIILLPAALGVGFVVQHLLRRQRIGLLLACLALGVLEQGRWIPSYSKQQARAEDGALARQIDPTANAFFLTPTQGKTDRYHVDALWVYLETGIPTINGHSGNQPPRWPFLEMPLYSPDDRRRVRKELFQWLTLWGLEDRRICWLEVPQDPDGKAPHAANPTPR